MILAAQDRQPPDTLTPHVLRPVDVSATRSDRPLAKTPHAVASVERVDISRGRATWGLDEALLAVPGVYAANRYNFSLDQRISIRGFGSRSAFAVRGVKVLVDGIPQTLPDGQGQLTNLDLGLVDRIEVLRGAASALYGNASGGVISVWTNPVAPAPLSQELRVVSGSFDRQLDRTWSKWHSTTRFRLGRGSGLVHVSRLGYEGERDHSAADLRYLNTRFHFPVAPAWSLSVTADLGDQPRADNPGALTAEELRIDPTRAAPANLAQRAGKDVSQVQAGATLRREFPGRGQAALTVFGLTRDLRNPQTFAYIDVDRVAYGTRLTVAWDGLTAGLDFQGLRDDRVNFGNADGRPDTVRSLDQRERVTELGPFVQGVIDLGPAASLTAGVRYDRVSFRVRDRLITATNPDDSGERVMDAASGSLGVAVAGGPDDVTLYANVGSTFETPTTTELANRPDTAGGFNANLEPQRAWSYEIGLRQGGEGRGGTGRDGEGVTWSVAVFRTDVRNLLVSFEVPGSPQRRFFRNAGRARHIGLELGAAASLSETFDAVLSWTFSNFAYRDYEEQSPGGATFRLDGRALPGIPEHWVRILARGRPRFAKGGWVEIEQAVSSGYLVDDTASVRAEPWAATHVRFGWDGRVGSTRFGPFVGLNNVFNHRYVGSVVINAARARYFEPAAGRNLYLGVSVEASRKTVKENRQGKP